MKYWLTSLDRKTHQRAMNRLVHRFNKALEEDDLWLGRFMVRQIYCPQWHKYEDNSGAELFVHLKFIDRATGRYWIAAHNVNEWRGFYNNGYRLFETMNWLITEHRDVWQEDLARERRMNGANTIKQHERFDIMKVNCQYIIRYLRDVYGGKVMFRRNSLIIETDGEEFQVKLLDRTSRGNFVFCHMKTGNCFEDSDLARGIFLAWNYKLNTELGVPLTEEDWFYFMRDAYRYAEEYYVNSKSLCQASL